MQGQRGGDVLRANARKKWKSDVCETYPWATAGLSGDGRLSSATPRFVPLQIWRIRSRENERKTMVSNKKQN